MNQISGINVTSYYMTYVFINALGFSEFTARVLAAAGSMDYLFFSFMAYFVFVFGSSFLFLLICPPSLSRALSAPFWDPYRVSLFLPGLLIFNASFHTGRL